MVVGANGFMQMLYKGVRKVYAHKLGNRGLLFAKTLDEAQKMIAEARASGD